MKIAKCFPIALVLIAFVRAASCDTCYRTICTSVRQRQCVYRTWQGCCLYRWKWVAQTRRESFCCQGFTGPGCNTPICNPPCANGGTCTSPGVCKCGPDFIGPTCDGDRPCSVRAPCYPGRCTTSSCECQANFTGGTCLKRSAGAPEIFQSRVRLVSVKVSTDDTLNGMRMYELFTDSSSPNEDIVDEIWSNQDGFNRLELYGTSQFDPQGLLPKPPYVDEASFGVISADANVVLTKLSPTSGSRRTSKNQTYPCREVGGGTIAPFWNCTGQEEHFDFPFTNADELDVTFTFKSGGSRQLVDPRTRIPSEVQNYQELTARKKMKIRFDLELPSHCNCSEQPLSINEDITKNPVQITWAGWRDVLSGMYRFAWEVFRLEPFTTRGELREPRPLQPIIHTPHFVANGSLPITYTPTEPGVYSVILEASDLANNSRYARRIFIYDNVSSVTTREKRRLFVSSAAASTNNTWQAHLADDIAVEWSGHFVNLLHDEKKYLNPVLEYPTQFTDIVGDGRFTQKRIEFDDSEGLRSREGIPNKDGIVKFEISHDKDHQGGTTLTTPQSWRVVSNISTNLVIPGLNRSRGDTVRIWVRASDVMGNTLVDSTLVSFDDTRPSLNVTGIRRNVPDGVFTYSSILDLETLDEDSGIWGITWSLSRDSNGENLKTGSLDPSTYEITKSACGARPATCRCTPTNKCHVTSVQLPINHCWLVLDKQGISSEVINMEINVTNPAMLTATETTKIKNIESLTGVGEYAPPRDVRVIRGGFNTVRIAWNNTPSCYNVTELWVRLSNDPVKQKVHRLSKFYDITGLQAATNYTAFLITGYSGDMSDEVPFVFRTGPAPEFSGLTAGAGAGIGIGVLLLLIVVAVVLLWQFGIIAVITGRKSKKPMTKAAVAFSKMSRKVRGTAVDDDIYVYGGDNFDIPIGVQFSASRLTLEEMIAEGKFARIYRASLTTGDEQNKTVVAKMCKESDDGEARQVMKGKILYYLNEIGEHRSVLHMLGTVLENDGWGPVMVLEYCELGTMRSWLIKQKGAVNDDVIERLFQFAFGIVQGMAYLSQAGVVHKRLAARNILLTFLLDVRITGFGPSTVNEGDEEEEEKERVPVRWVAPECIKSSRAATEKSDVWSFGVVLWEIFSLGDTPYPTLKTHEVPVKVRGGHRMNKPELADEYNYTMMLQCWDAESRKRPKFRELERSYQKLMSGGGDDYNNYSNYSKA